MSIRVAICCSALGVVRDDIERSLQLEGYILQVLWRRPRGVHEADEEVTGLALRTGHDQGGNINRVSPDVAGACQLTSDASGNSRRAKRHESSIVIVDQHIHIAGCAAWRPAIRIGYLGICRR